MILLWNIIKKLIRLMVRMIMLSYFKLWHCVLIGRRSLLPVNLFIRKYLIYNPPILGLLIILLMYFLLLVIPTKPFIGFKLCSKIPLIISRGGLKLLIFILLLEIGVRFSIIFFFVINRNKTIQKYLKNLLICIKRKDKTN